MRVLVIGGGGREHALAWKLAQSPAVSQVISSPGNPGCALVGPCLRSAAPTPDGFLAVAEQTRADLTVVGPEAPLVAGVVDLFRSKGRHIIGPTAQAAQLEGSKVFSKEFMRRAGVPTAAAYTAETATQARDYLNKLGYPVVIKADGLAAGKGVVIAENEHDALTALAYLPRGRFVIEEFLRGEEVSFIVYTDGARAVALEATQDHKTVHDGDTGPNTGGMGAYCDGRILTAAQAGQIMDLVIHPSLQRIRDDGVPYTGFLYAGLMMTADGPKVLEFNARLGDPETQPLMHRMTSDILPTLLDCEPPHWSPDPSVCIVLAAHGYPGDVRTGDPITGHDRSSAIVFQAGTRASPNGIETSGGRVLGVTASGPDLRIAIANAYAGVDAIHFDGMHYRRDIGQKGMKRW